MQHDQKKIKYFETSNKIEGVLDPAETELALSFTDRDCTEETLLDFHSKMGHLNSYCIPGEYRTYPVYVGDQEGIHYSKIQSKMDYLFMKNPETDESFEDDFETIKLWHVNFEKAHPFGDGNGRAGRLLMWIQCRDAGCLDELYKEFEWDDGIVIGDDGLQEMKGKPFMYMRKDYYDWFK